MMLKRKQRRLLLKLVQTEAEKDRISSEIKSEVADLSLEISEKVASSMTKKDQQKLIDKFIKDMG